MLFDRESNLTKTLMNSLL